MDGYNACELISSMKFVGAVPCQQDQQLHDFLWVQCTLTCISGIGLTFTTWAADEVIVGVSVFGIRDSSILAI